MSCIFNWEWKLLVHVCYCGPYWQSMYTDVKSFAQLHVISHALGSWHYWLPNHFFASPIKHFLSLLYIISTSVQNGHTNKCHAQDIPNIFITFIIDRLILRMIKIYFHTRFVRENCEYDTLLKYCIYSWFIITVRNLNPYIICSSIDTVFD